MLGLVVADTTMDQLVVLTYPERNNVLGLDASSAEELLLPQFTVSTFHACGTRGSWATPMIEDYGDIAGDDGARWKGVVRPPESRRVERLTNFDLRLPADLETWS